MSRVVYWRAPRDVPTQSPVILRSRRDRASRWKVSRRGGWHWNRAPPLAPRQLAGRSRWLVVLKAAPVLEPGVRDQRRRSIP